MKHHAFQSNPKSDSQCSHATDTTCATWHVRSLRSSRSNGEMWDGSIWKPYIYCLEPHMDLFSFVFHAWKNTRSTIILGNWKTLLSGVSRLWKFTKPTAVFRVFICFQDSWTRYRETCHGKISWFFFNGCHNECQASFASSDSSGVPRWRLGVFVTLVMARYIWKWNKR